MPVRDDTYPDPSAYEVGWEIPFLATCFLISHHHIIKSAFIDFCAGKRHQIMARARVEAVKIIAKRDGMRRSSKVTLLIGPSPKYGHRILFILWLGACVDETSENCAVNRAFTNFWCGCRWKQ